MTYPVQLTLSHPHWQEYRLSPKNPILTLEPNQQYLLLVFPEAPFFIESANQKHNITQAGFQIFPISGSLKVSSSSSSEQTLQCFRFSSETKFTDDFHCFFSLSANKKEQLNYIREATTKNYCLTTHETCYGLRQRDQSPLPNRAVLRKSEL